MNRKKTCPKCHGTLRVSGGCNICEILQAGAESNVVSGGTQTTGWPLYSEAAGVHPKKVKAQEAIDRRLGVPTTYTKDGRCVFTDRGHRKKWLKAHKLRDNSGGYGD